MYFSSQFCLVLHPCYRRTNKQHHSKGETTCLFSPKAFGFVLFSEPSQGLLAHLLRFGGLGVLFGGSNRLTTEPAYRYGARTKSSVLGMDPGADAAAGGWQLALGSPPDTSRRNWAKRKKGGELAQTNGSSAPDCSTIRVGYPS